MMKLPTSAPSVPPAAESFAAYYSRQVLSGHMATVEAAVASSEVHQPIMPRMSVNEHWQARPLAAAAVVADLAVSETFFKGVTKVKDMYAAHVSENGTARCLGMFETQEEASKCYLKHIAIKRPSSSSPLSMPLSWQPQEPLSMPLSWQPQEPTSMLPPAPRAPAPTSMLPPAPRPPAPSKARPRELVAAATEVTLGHVGSFVMESGTVTFKPFAHGELEARSSQSTNVPPPARAPAAVSFGGVRSFVVGSGSVSFKLFEQPSARAPPPTQHQLPHVPEPGERKERSEVRKRRLQVEDFTQPQLQSLMTGAPTARKSFQLTSNAPMPSMRDEATSKGSLHRSLLQPSRASGELDTLADGFRGPDKLASHVDGFELRMDPGSKTGYYGVQYSNVLRSFLAFVRLDEASDEPGSSAAKTAAAELKPAGERSSSRLGSGGGSGDGGGDGGSKSPNEQAPCPHCGKCFVHGSKAIRNAHVECCAVVSGMTTTPARRKMHAKPSSTSSEDVSARSILLGRYPTAVEAAVALAHLAALCASKLTAPELWDCDDRDVGRLCKDAESAVLSILRPKEGEPAGPAAKRPKPSANAPELQAGACMACRHMKAPCRPCDDSEGRCSNCVRCGIDCFFEESPDPVGAGRSIAGLAPPAPTATPGAAARASVTVVPSAARASAKAVPQALPRRLSPSPKQQMKPWDKKKLTGWTPKEEQKFN
jgi:hypothetical protein